MADVRDMLLRTRDVGVTGAADLIELFKRIRRTHFSLVGVPQFVDGNFRMYDI